MLCTLLEQHTRRKRLILWQVLFAASIKRCMNTEKTQSDLSEQDFVALLVKHEPALRAFARALLPEWDLVDEALQDASVTIWKKRELLNDSDGFLPWARAIVRFKCMQQLGKLRMRRTTLSDEMLDALAERGQNRPADLIAARGRAMSLCLRQFSMEHRELLLVPHTDGCSVTGLAEQRRKSANALYKLLGRLRSQLKECIARRITVEAS
ncbi:MAG: sigma factor [Planctomycetota bacterium]